MPVVAVAASVQLPELPNEPHAGADVKLTVPVGVLAPLVTVSVTVAAHAMAAPVGVGEGAHATAVEDGSVEWAGLNVTSSPSVSTAVHWSADGHATPLRAPRSTCNGVGLPGEFGLKVTAVPGYPTPVHWLAEGHATADWSLPGVVVTVGLPGESGSKVTNSWPSPSTAVH